MLHAWLLEEAALKTQLSSTVHCSVHFAAITSWSQRMLTASLASC